MREGQKKGWKNRKEDWKEEEEGENCKRNEGSKEGDRGLSELEKLKHGFAHFGRTKNRKKHTLDQESDQEIKVRIKKMK